MASANVIKSLQTKDNSGFSSPSYLGTEQYFVSPLRGSSINNLEEQFVIGVDCITSSWIDEQGVKRTNKEFYNADVKNPKNYYVLEIYEYLAGSTTKTYIDYMPKGGDPEQGEILTLKIPNEKGHIGEEPNQFYFDSDVFKFNEDKSEVLINSDDLLSSLEQLYFINNVNNKILVSEKRVFDYVDDEGKKITKEIITNHLS